MAYEEGDEIEKGDITEFDPPPRADASTWLEKLQTELFEKTWLDLCLADFHESYADLDKAHEPFLHMNVLEWGGLVHPVHDGSWVYLGEKLHPKFESIGAVLTTTTIDTWQVTFFNTLRIRITAMLIGSRMKFMEEVVETIPVMFPYIYKKNIIPDKSDIEEICKGGLEIEQFPIEGDPINRMLGAIAHELNAQLWRVVK